MRSAEFEQQHSCKIRGACIVSGHRPPVSVSFPPDADLRENVDDAISMTRLSLTSPAHFDRTRDCLILNEIRVQRRQARARSQRTLVVLPHVRDRRLLV